MRRRLAAVAIVVASVVGMVAGAPEPADAHSVSNATSQAICSYGNPNPSTWDLYAFQTVHYGSAHVTQCAYTYTYPVSDASTVCKQYVWNIPSPYWSSFQDTYPNPPFCW